MKLMDWTTLLDQPKAILGAYAGTAPSLTTFAPYAWHADAHQVAFAGQFLQLPEKVPPRWGSADKARADFVFTFSGIRALHVDGMLLTSPNDDSLHGNPCGEPGDCSLIALPEAFLLLPDGSTRPWKQFRFVQRSFSFQIEAGNVRIVSGRRAASHPEDV